jgi:hypothetical protein
VLDEATQLAHDLTPHAITAIEAYGVAVLTRAQDDAADSTVTFGRRLLRRLTGRDDPDAAASEDQVALAGAIRDVAEAPQDGELATVLRAYIRRLLQSDPDLAGDIGGWPRPAAPASVTITTSGERSPAVYTNYGGIHTGDTTPGTRP